MSESDVMPHGAVSMAAAVDASEGLERAAEDGDRPATVWLRIVGSTVIVMLGGEHDLATEPDMANAFDAAARRQPALVLVDLSACSYADSSALRVLLRAREAADARACRFALVVPDATSSVARLLAATRLGQPGEAGSFTVYRSADEALDARRG